MWNGNKFWILNSVYIPFPPPPPPFLTLLSWPKSSLISAGLSIQFLSPSLLPNWIPNNLFHASLSLPSSPLTLLLTAWKSTLPNLSLPSCLVAGSFPSHSLLSFLSAFPPIHSVLPFPFLSHQLLIPYRSVNLPYLPLYVVVCPFPSHFLLSFLF